MATLPPDILNSLWRLNPATMAMRLTANEPNPEQRWQLATHLRLLSTWIVDAISGKRPRIIINMPPRHGKSFLVSQWMPIWMLDNFPHKTVINVGYSVTYAEEWGRKVRDLSTRYQENLRFNLSPDSKAAGRWNTTQGGGMFCTGIDGGLTGRGASACLIIDDPHKDSAEANSLLQRDKVWRWWQETAISRIEPGAAVILVMTRWHEDDLSGRLIKASENGTGEHWDVLNLPAIAGVRNADGDWVASDEPDVLGRAPGEPLWPELRPLEYMLGKMQGSSQEAWDAQYQGRPGNLVRAGNVYKSFSKKRNVRPLAFDPKRPLVWSMDFNVDPMCSTLCQWHEEMTATTFLDNQFKRTVSVLQEMCLPNSSTQEMCEEFVSRTEKYVETLRGHKLHVRIYGDRSGQSRKTSGDSDYLVVKDFFKARSEYAITMHLDRANPSVKDRVNAVNAMLCNAAGEVRTLIDPSCKELIDDMLQVQWKRDSSGNTTGQIDKSDMKRTHVSDAYGYFIKRQFSLQEKGGEQPGLLQ